MIWWEVGGFVAAILIVWQALAYFNGNPKFWRLVGRNPDIALTLFAIEHGCLVDVPPSHEQKADYTGSFSLLTTDGVTHKVYFMHDQIDTIQARVAQVLYAAEGRAPHLGIH